MFYWVSQEPPHHKWLQFLMKRRKAKERKANWGGGRQKLRSSYNGKYILFQKKGTLSQKQPNYTSAYGKHGGINSYFIFIQF